jgi:hypothetical protein
MTMAKVSIPVQALATDDHRRLSVILDGERWRFDFYTSSVDDRWYFDVRGDDGSDPIRGLALAAGVRLLDAYRHLHVPPGVLYLDADEDPDATAFFDGRAKLLYKEAEP